MDTKEILEQRGQIYGDVRDNMNCQHAMMEAWRTHFKPDAFMSEYDRIGFEGCIAMVMHKLARIATGGRLDHADNYDDVAGYIELAKGIATKERVHYHRYPTEGE